MAIIDPRFMTPKYDTFRKLGLIAFAIGLFIGLVVYLCALSLKNQRYQFEIKAQNTAALIRSGFDVVDGVATSLHAMKDGVQTQSESYTRTVINDYSFLSAIGRFEKVSSAEIFKFSAEIADREGQELTSPPWWFDENGHRITTGQLNAANSVQTATHTYFPVTRIKTDKSNKADLLPFVGFDIGSDPGVHAAIAKAAASGKTMLASVPRFWPNSSSILGLRASYTGAQIPANTKSRRENLDGGYWFEIDIEKLGQLDGVVSRLGLQLELVRRDVEFSMDSGHENIYRRAAPKSDLLFSEFFRAQEWISSFEIGNQTYNLRLSSPRGLTTRILFSSTAFSVLALSLLTLLFSLNIKRQKALRKQRQQSERLYNEQQRASVTLSSIGDAVLTVDASNDVQYANIAAEKLLNLGKSNIIGVNAGAIVREVFEDEHGNRLATSDHRTPLDIRQSDEVISGDMQLQRIDGTSVAVRQTISPLVDKSGQRNGSVIVLRDNTAERELTNRLEHQVNHDSLTGLANRFNFEKCLENLFETGDKQSEHAVCFIDLDRFKQINDTCGHHAGDQLLVQMSAALNAKIRSNDLLARLGGDEFGVILYNCDFNAADSITKRIHRFFKSYQFEYEDKVFPVRGSLGLVHFGLSESKLDAVLSAADAACYVAKKNGRNSVHMVKMQHFEAELSHDEQLWMPRIQDALENDGFTLLLQPIAAVADGALIAPVHYEFLLRMIDEDGKLILPVEFLKSAERYELMERIDRWVIRTAISTVAGLPDHMRDCGFTINLSSASLQDGKFIKTISDTASQFGVDCRRLCLEIDESVVLSDFETASAIIRKLKLLGCSIALDDFGAGVTSLSILRELLVDYLKIDGQFISDITTSQNDENMVRSIHSFAQSMGLQTIAEKVENAAAIQLLAEIGINYAQGYAIERPLPLQSIVENHAHYQDRLGVRDAA